MKERFGKLEKKNVELQEEKKSLEQMIYEIGHRVSLFNIAKTEKVKKNKISGFENLILEELSRKGTLNISELCNIFPSTSGGTVSTKITDLWKNKKLVNKNRSPEDQRITLVNLTAKGKTVLEKLRQEQFDSYSELKSALNLKSDEEETVRKIFDKAAIFFDEAIYVKKEK